MNDHLISYGKIITNPSDPLEKVSIERLLKGLRTPKPDIEAKVRNLRIIYSIDKKRYNEVKRQLPYVVCGIFNPPFRKVENFAYTEYFIVDIDHIASKGLNLMNVRQNIETDPRVLITFVSPSQDGIKVLFRLKERCCDSGIYSLFYRAFVQKFSEMYQLQQVIDARTSDVSRACFISVDPDAHYNETAVPVDIADYIDLNDTHTLFDRDDELKEAAKQAQPPRVGPKPASEKDPDADIISQIRETLGIKPRERRKAPVHVPDQLNDIIGEIKAYVERTGIVVTQIIDIQYGKKIRMKMGLSEAEINVFYGKKGYSVVITPRSGTNPTLNALCADIINGFFAEREIL